MRARRWALSAGLAALLLTGGGWSVARALSPARWSDPATWGGRLPQAGDDVEIPAGRTILLDVSPPPLRYLRVDGTLVAAERPFRLAAKTILVHGELRVGTPERPFRERAEFVLGPVADANTDGAIHIEGRLEVHGAPEPRAWTRLARTAEAGSREMTLAETPHWSPGDAIVLGATEGPGTSERATVAGVRGRTVILGGPLAHRHYGVVERGVDLRAPVGLLSRNIVFRAADATGAHLMAMGGSRVRLEGAEFAGFGVPGRLARYPIHFHLAGDQRAGYVRETSVHDSANRALTIHGTNGLPVRDVVAAGVRGHAFFVEDGDERGNSLTHNLAIGVTPPDEARRLLPSDREPAGFWLTNPSNDLVGNVASDVVGHGIWYALVPGERQGEMGVFRGNAALSVSRTGLLVDGEANAPGVYGAPTYLPPHGARFEGMTSVGCGGRGIWIRGRDIEVTNARIADCAIGATLAASRSVFRGGTILGTTAHLGPVRKPENPAFPARGFEMYDGPVTLKDTTIVGYHPDAVRKASAIAYLRFTPWFVHPENDVLGLRLVDSLPILFEPLRSGGDGYRSGTVLDRDGSLTGTPGVRVLGPSSVLGEGGARWVRAWGAWVSTGRYARLFIDFPGADPRDVAPLYLQDPEGRRTRLDGQPFDGGAASFQTTVPLGGGFEVRGGRRSRRFPARVTLRFAQAGESVWLTFPSRGETVELTIPEGKDAVTARVE